MLSVGCIDIWAKHPFFGDLVYSKGCLGDAVAPTIARVQSLPPKTSNLKKTSCTHYGKIPPTPLRKGGFLDLLKKSKTYPCKALGIGSA